MKLLVDRKTQKIDFVQVLLRPYGKFQSANSTIFKQVSTLFNKFKRYSADFILFHLISTELIYFHFIYILKFKISYRLQ